MKLKLVGTAVVLSLLGMSAPLAQSGSDFLGGMVRLGIGVMINEALESGSTRNQGGPAPQTRPSNPASEEVRQVQQALNRLGFDAGGADGRMGPKTARAIAAYQASIGATGNGTLTSEQVARLLSSPAPAQVAASGVASAMERLDGFDLPGHDYRSGLDDDALKSITASQCEALCAADQQCQAFTFNAAAKVCFLKDQLAEPTAFAGAISGRKSTMGAAGFGPASAGETGLAALGLTLRNGEIVVGSSTVGFDDFSPGLWRLQLLLALKADPSLLEQRHLTALFATILPPERTNHLLIRNYSGAWVGESEFAQEDSRRTFIAQFGPELMSMVPDLPLTLVDVRNIGLGRYDFDTQVMPVDISRYLPWQHMGQIGFDADVPAELPGALRLPLEEARQLAEGTVPGVETLPSYRPVAALRYTINDVRRNRESSVVLDIVVEDFVLYADEALSLRIMDLPLGAATIRAEGDVVASGEAPVLDATLVRVLALDADGSLLDAPGFFAETFAVRRAQEKEALSRGPEDVNFARIMPSMLLQDMDLGPDRDHEDAVRAWLVDAAEGLGDLITMPDDVLWNRTGNTLILAGRSYSIGREEEAMIRSRFPNSLDFGQVPGGDDLTLLFAFHPDKNWTDTSILAGRSEDDRGRLVVRVLEREVVAGANGQRYLLVDLAPHAVRIDRNGTLVDTIALSGGAVPDIGTASDGSLPVSRFAVLGMTLGMPVEEARALVDERFAGAETTPLVQQSTTLTSCGVVASRGEREIRSIGYDIEYQRDMMARDRFGNDEDHQAQVKESEAAIAALEKRLEERRAVLLADLEEEGCRPAEASPLQFAFGIDIVHNKDLTERLAVYQVGSLIGPPVVSAIYRSFSADTIGEQFLEGLKTTYGPDFASNAGQMTWVDNPMLSARFAENGDEQCLPFWPGDDPYPAAYIHVDCGAYIRAEYYRMVLVDTRFTARVLGEQQAEDLAREQDQAPKLQF